MRVLDKKGVVHLDEGGTGPLPEVGDEQSRPEIVPHSFLFFHLLFLTLPRTQLRQIFLDSLEKDTVKWKHEIKSITLYPPSPNTNCSSPTDTKKQLTSS